MANWLSPWTEKLLLEVPRLTRGRFCQGRGDSSEQNCGLYRSLFMCIYSFWHFFFKPQGDPGDTHTTGNGADGEAEGETGMHIHSLPPPQLVPPGPSLASHYPPIRHYRFPCGLGWFPKAGSPTISRSISASKGGVKPWEMRTAVMRAAPPLHWWKKAVKIAGTGEIFCLGRVSSRR